MLKTSTVLPVLTALVGAGVIALGTQVRAGGDKVVFPEGFDKGVMFTTVDRADNKQYREVFTSQAALDAAKTGEPLPDRTVITLVQYKAKLDAQGNPEKDANGRFIKTDILGYTVMEKRKGWGAEYDEKIRNGEWEYQAFTPAKAVNANAKLTACFECHKPLPQASDFLFTYGKMAGK
jgi:Cytochrome P460